jgi:hypothetical protein
LVASDAKNLGREIGCLVHLSPMKCGAENCA